jgi:N-acyl-D-aspartate/D-glutamate deacylase
MERLGRRLTADGSSRGSFVVVVVVCDGRMHLSMYGERQSVVQGDRVGLMTSGLSTTGYVATVVSGTVAFRAGEPTGSLVGRLVRGALPAPTS